MRIPAHLHLTPGPSIRKGVMHQRYHAKATFAGAAATATAVAVAADVAIAVAVPGCHSDVQVRKGALVGYPKKWGQVQGT